MDDSDDDYIEKSSGDEQLVASDGISRRTRNRTTSTKPGANGRSSNQNIDTNLKGANGGYAWEDEYQRSWDLVQEDEGGSLAGILAGLVEARKKRFLKDTTPFQRGIIRNMILVLDMSFAMLEKDLRPNRYALMLSYAIEFVNEFFDQNPVSQLGIIGMRDGLAIPISDVGGNPHAHIAALQSIRKQEPKGSPSLQNALELARGLLYHVPVHCTREVLIIFGALLSSDPGDIHHTVENLVDDKVRVRVIGLAAQVAICKELCMKTNNNDETSYGVILNESHFKELLMEATTPLAATESSTYNMNGSALIQMGFPSKISEIEPTLCACHSELTQGGYICPVCSVKVCNLPTVCPSCNLTLILSTHLARSYHHLFPLKPFKDVSVRDLWKAHNCTGCQKMFPEPETLKTSNGEEEIITMRYACMSCTSQFCIDCDVFCHDVLHNCPGCQAKSSSQIKTFKRLSKVKLNLKRPAPSE
ncbi:component of the core form of RNA polymerase transcription factor [Nadsonia fulvescens var. elongata DSM 6958]|uniref:General transcription and DNA repair factor IIH n=1 Tax=Nadsonia fulvescens var. elongata DSM 6958 TaxID=857566 RepID=A0A1E3PKD1_9ASCO|nr:component of the core form of RNA polymerase transcription factor [Nadsonia fulvescens var. elongata DSM 6958]